MEYVVLKKCMIKGVSHNAGVTVVLDTQTARELLRIGRVGKMTEPVVELENRAVGLDEDPVEKPTTRRYKKKESSEVESE